MRAAHGTISDDVPAAPEPPAYIGIPVDIEEQRELFRQAEMRRAAAFQNANGARPWWDQDRNANWMMERRREEEERMARLRRQRELEDQERRLREQRLLREAEERRRAQQERQSGGWGCTIM